MEPQKNKKELSPTQTLLAGYCLIILAGAFLLALPFSSVSGKFTNPLTALFTATSSACVTGLVLCDTFSYWSLFGQLVILALIQTGGLGFMTIAVTAISHTRIPLGLNSRLLAKEAISLPKMSGVVRLTKLIIRCTVICEGAGALLLAAYYCPKMGLKGIYYGVFHSVSAFCNAGFDLMGSVEEYSSMMTLRDNAYVNIILMLLIVIGGLGFFVWEDLWNNRRSLKNVSLHTKLVLVVSLVLIAAGTGLLILFENGGPLYGHMSPWQKILYSGFQSVSARTAGFNTVDLNALTIHSKIVMICLMLAGGSTGSTAGGMKTTTVAIPFIAAISIIRGRKHVECFGRRIDENTQRTALVVIVFYIMATLFSAVFISFADKLPMDAAFFEAASAIATVGLSLGITRSLGTASKIIIILLMLVGRAGSITVLSAIGTKKNVPSSLPIEPVQIG